VGKALGLIELAFSLKALVARYLAGRILDGVLELERVPFPT
jgi:hypothetical protein